MGRRPCRLSGLSQPCSIHGMAAMQWQISYCLCLSRPLPCCLRCLPVYAVLGLPSAAKPSSAQVSTRAKSLSCAACPYLARVPQGSQMC